MKPRNIYDNDVTYWANRHILNVISPDGHQKVIIFILSVKIVYFIESIQKRVICMSQFKRMTKIKAAQK